MIDGTKLPDREPQLARAMLREIVSPVSDVRLWLVELDGPDDEDADAWLSPSEKARAGRFRFQRDAKRYRTGHVALRRLLSHHGDVLAGTEFQIGPNGKPAIGTRPFNTSDSDALLLVAIGTTIGGTAIGVDLELLRPMDDSFDLAQRHFSAAERASLRAAAPDEVVRMFLTGWTRKEACLKAVGLGLNVETSTIEVGLDRQERVVVVPSDCGTTTVRVRSIDAGAGVLAALALVEASQPGRLG